jgi:hypothetical protein
MPSVTWFGRLWLWLRGAGSWVLSLLIALPVVGFALLLWWGERASRQRAEADFKSERERSKAWRLAMEAHAAATRKAQAALRERDLELARIHEQAAQDIARIDLVHGRLTEKLGAGKVAEFWDEAMGITSEEHERGKAP